MTLPLERKPGLIHLSLFSGIGGIDLAAEWAGFQTVCFVEKDKYCQQVLRKHWPEIPIIEDVKDVTKEKIMAYARLFGQAEHQEQTAGIEQRSEAITNSQSQQDRRLQFARVSPDTGTGSERIGIDLISGGFPCQPHSVAGKRKGSSDERNLWPEFRRVIGEIKSRWVLAENVPGLFSSDAGRFFGEVLADLASLGYSVGWCTYGVVDVGALHRRDRVFIVAHALNCSDRGGRGQGRETDGLQGINRETLCGGMPCGTGEQPRSLAYASIKGLEGTNSEGRTPAEGLPTQCGKMVDTESEPSDGLHGIRSDARYGEYRGCSSSQWEYWSVEPPVGRVAHGVPHRVDRLKGLGNAVVPQQIYPVLKAIADCDSLLA